MKNRLQFNRIPALFASGVTYLSGTTIGVSGREKATEALETFIKRRDFIPLIGEPIVVRYIDDKGKKQLMLAIGKATGSTENDTRGIEYHIIDSAKLQEDIDLANANAAEALDLASAATHDVANYLVILKNMIGPNGIFMEDGSFFDGTDDDPSNCGLYKNWSGNPAPYQTTYISGATNMFEADLMLDDAIQKTNVRIDVLSGVTEETIDSLNELWEAAAALSAATIEFSANTVYEFKNVRSDIDETNERIDELSAATESFSAGTSSLINNIIEGAGLNNGERGSYPGHDETHYIKDATSLDNADVILDAAIWNLSGTVIELSANTVAALEEAGDDIEELSAATVAIEEALEQTNDDLAELSAATVEIEYKEENIIEAAGLNPDGSYERDRDANYIKDAESLYEADEMLDLAIANLSANTMAADQALNDKIDELSANTMAADQNLQDQIDELGNRKVLGISAITVEVLDNGDSRVSLVINEEDDKVLTQNTLGLKANVSLVYSRDDKKIYLKGKNETVISEIDANDFIKDGMLSAASVIVATEEDHEMYPELIVGKTYIKLLFNVDGEVPGRANPVFISAEDLVDTYTVAPESYTYMSINDYVIKLNVDVENGLASYNYARNISAVTTNIISATGLNMGEQGGYPGHDETHYIKNAVNLDNADVLLDEAIWNTSGMVGELSANTDAAINELSANTDSAIKELSAVTAEFSGTTHSLIENIIAAAGLEDDEHGSYPGHDETHYIKDATSLDNADVILDEALWTLSGVVADLGDVSELEEKIDNLSAVTKEFSAATYYEVIKLSAATEDCYRAISALSANVITYVDNSITNLSGDVIEYINNITDELDERLDVVEEELSGLTILSAAVESFSAATYNELNEIHEEITSLGEDVSELSAFTEFLSAHTLGVLTVNLNGTEQGKYCPSASTTLELTAITEVTGEDVLLTGYEISSATDEDDLVVLDTDNVNEAFGKIEKKILDNELVTAAALNELDGRVEILEDNSAVLSGDVAALSASVVNNVTNINVLSGAVEDLSGTTVANTQNITNLSAYTEAVDVDLRALSASVVNNVEKIDILSATILTDEYVVAAALNDLNDRIEELSGRTEASKLDHEVTLSLAGEAYGSASTDFSDDEVNIATYKKFTTGDSVTNLTLSEFLTVVTLDSNATLTVANSGLPVLPAGGVKEAHIIIENESSAAILVTLDSTDARFKITNGDRVYIAGNSIGEVNALITYDGSNYTIYMITS